VQAGRVLALAGMLACAGGCSIPLGSMFDKKSDSSDEITTGSIKPANPAANAAATATPSRTAKTPPNERDLAYAREVASQVVSREGKDASLPWENPQTGARGTVTALTSAYTQAGVTCRDFLASYVQAGSEAWMQGEACRQSQGKWEVRSLKPWSRT
jgi:surface antigen